MIEKILALIDSYTQEKVQSIRNNLSWTKKKPFLYFEDQRSIIAFREFKITGDHIRKSTQIKFENNN